MPRALFVDSPLREGRVAKQRQRPEVPPIRGRDPAAKRPIRGGARRPMGALSPRGFREESQWEGKGETGQGRGTGS